MRKLFFSIPKASRYASRVKVRGAVNQMKRPRHSQLVATSHRRSGENVSLEEYEFEVVGEEQIYRRYLTLTNRKISFPATDTRPAVTHEYDIISHPQCKNYFTVTFPFHSGDSGKPAEVTLLREHCQGPNQMMFVLPTGGWNPERHSSHLACAQAELSEEAKLRGGDWQSLLDPEHPGIAEVKWCANRFTPFLCIDPKDDAQPGDRDPEEFIEIHRVSITDLRKIMVSGEMLLPSVSTCFMAIERLKQLGLQTH